MGCILISYSLTGHVQFLCEKIVSQLGCEWLQLAVKRPYPTKGFAKFYRGGRDATFHWPVRLATPIPDLSAFSTIIIATPVWASTVSTPIDSLLRKVDLSQKRVYLVISCSGGDTRKCRKRILKLATGSTYQGCFLTIDPKEDSWDGDTELQAFCQAVQQGNTYE